MKKIILFFAMCLFSMASFAEILYSGDVNETITWTLDDEGMLTISGEGNMPDYTYSARPPWDSYKWSNDFLSIIIDDGITTIGDYAFSDYFDVDSVKIPNSVESIGISAFQQCDITNLNIPNTVEIIKDFAFLNCWGLTSIEIPNSVLNIGAHAFNCRNLKEVIISWDDPSFVSLEDGVFGETNIPSSCILKVPQNTSRKYKQAEIWQDFIIIEQINAEITPDAHISWQSTEDATDYQLILFSDEAHTDTLRVINFDANGDFISEQQLRFGDAGGFSYQIQDLSAATTYYYTLRAFQDTETIAQQDGAFTTVDAGTTSVSEVPASSVKVYAIDRTIFIENIQGENIALYDTQGQLLAAKQNADGAFQADVPQAGVYVVRAGSESWKVVVR